MRASQPARRGDRNAHSGKVLGSRVLFGAVIGLVLVTLGLPTWAIWGLLMLVAWLLGPALGRWFLRR